MAARELTVLTPSTPPALDQESPDRLHELRVRVPDDLHRQLRAIKVLRGKSLGETVTAALDAYFGRAEPEPVEKGA